MVCRRIMKEATEINLKKCPFCGSDAKANESLKGNWRFSVGCSNPRCAIRYKGGESVADQRNARRQDIADRWNRRDGVEGEIQKLRQWISDLQSGMYINCVYCGHRYGPASETPVAMAETLKEHIERCPDHPMSILKKDYKTLVRLVGSIMCLMISHLTYQNEDEMVECYECSGIGVGINEVIHDRNCKTGALFKAIKNVESHSIFDEHFADNQKQEEDGTRD